MIGIVLFVLSIVWIIGYLVWFCFGQSEMSKTISIIINVIMLMLSVIAFAVCITVHSMYPAQNDIELQTEGQTNEPETLSDGQSDEPESTMNVPESESETLSEERSDELEGTRYAPESELETLQLESDISEVQTDILDIQPEENETETTQIPLEGLNSLIEWIRNTE